MPVAPVKQLAPEYRYYTADLLTGEILAEIPFREVTYQKALKAAGAFRGKIPVITKTEHLNLYENTMPGKTALYAVRNGVCVWGGIIWTRTHNVVERALEVNASEFTSYLYHRRIWKTWSHQYEAIVSVTAAGIATVGLVNGSTTALVPGTSIHLEFYEVFNFKYNGYYEVGGTPTPTTTGFQVADARQIARIASGSSDGVLVTFTTEEPHKYTAGDIIEIDAGSVYDGQRVVNSVVGTTGTQFTIAYPGAVNPSIAIVGDVYREIPEGVYGAVTVTVRTDTFDYIRSLLDGVFNDFVGVDFPNIYIEPGLSYPVDITNIEVGFGKATIDTAIPHNLAIGQAVQIQDAFDLVDGEFTVTDTPSLTQFKYKLAGDIPSTPINITQENITAVSALDGYAKVFTDASMIQIGNHVVVDAGKAIPNTADTFSGTFIVSNIDQENYSWIEYPVASRDAIPKTFILTGTATVSGPGTKTVVKRQLFGNVATMTTTTAHGFSVGNSVTIDDVTPRILITEKSLDAANSLATISTATPHEFQSGDAIEITGLRDISNIKKITQNGTAVTLLTENSHNFAIGDSITVADMYDPYVVTFKEITAGVGKITTSTNHNMQVSDKLVITDIYDVHSPSTKALVDGVATLTLPVSHNYKVNQTVTVKDITDTVSIVSAAVENGSVVLTTAIPHNFFENDEITVSVFRPNGFAYSWNGTWKVLSVTDLQVIYEVDQENIKPPEYVAPFVVTGTAYSKNSIFNGEHVLSAVTSTTLSYNVTGNNVTSQTTAPWGGTTSAASALNGEWTITAKTATTASFATPGLNNLISTGVPLPPEPTNEGDRQPKPLATVLSFHNGTRTITSMTRNTITFTSSGVSMLTKDTNGTISVESSFNGSKYVATVLSPTQFTYAQTGKNNVLETGVVNKSYVTSYSLFNGTFPITTVPTTTTFTYARTHTNVAAATMPVSGTVTVSPAAIISTFGPYPGNADIGIKYSTRKPSKIFVPPTMYRGFELTTVGEALDNYSDSLGGFEYRIDSSFNTETNKFDKTFTFIPIDFPNPPGAGEVAPVTRYGADKLVFEYPGNIFNVTIEESAENSATRFFAVGETDLGPDAGPPFSVAAADDLLNGIGKGPDFRKWPILDDDEKIDNVDDEAVLYAYADRYLNENLPPDAKFTVQINGSLQPIVGSYSPGDWCSLIVNDDFVLMRLKTDLEPRDDVIIRKIDSIKVTVPDGTTFPEKVDLVLVPEWEVDKRG